MRSKLFMGLVLALVPLTAAFGQTTPTTELITGDPSNTTADNVFASEPLSISGDGRYVVFMSPDSVLWRYDRDTDTKIQVSVSPAGKKVKGYDGEISPTGRFVAFQGNDDQVYLRDLQAGKTTRVSINTKGVKANNIASRPSISSNGRFVAFDSQATNLGGKAPGTFLRDRKLETTKRICGCLYPQFASGGRFIALSGFALTPDTQGQAGVYVYDRTTKTSSLASVADDESFGNGSAGEFFDISADGRYVTFTSQATNLTAESDTNNALDVFLRDRTAGTTTLVSESTSGDSGQYTSDKPSVSDDGRFVAFESYSPNLVPNDTNLAGNDFGFTKGKDIFVRDVTMGSTTRVSVSTGNGESNADSGTADLSADGSYVAFQSQASNLFDPDPNGFRWDVFLRGPLL